MKKTILFNALLGIVAVSCSQTKTIYLNSQTVSCNAGSTQQCLQYKIVETDTAWTTYAGNIQGFTYNPGYFYTLQVQPVSKVNPSEWKLVKTVSKTKSTAQQPSSDSGIAQLSKPPAALVGQWNFTSLSPEAGGATFTKEFLRFDAVEMRVTGKASCNGFFGNYTSDTTKGEKAIHFEAIGHTMMACENLATENKMLHAMELVDNWQVTGNKLYLKAGTKTIIELTKAADNNTL